LKRRRPRSWQSRQQKGMDFRSPVDQTLRSRGVPRGARPHSMPPIQGQKPGGQTGCREKKGVMHVLLQPSGHEAMLVVGKDSCLQNQRMCAGSQLLTAWRPPE
jgi:hypothetical protein